MIFKEPALNIKDKLVEFRRDFHMHPEASFCEERTNAVIRKFLEDNGIEIQEVGAGYSVVGVIRGGKPGKTFALRADIDALPMPELNDVPYKSQNEGVMHACGHDAHTASLMGVALLINEVKDQMSGNVKLLFQAAEEKAPLGGARPMCEAGVMESPHVDAIVALHVVPSTDKAGKFGLKKGVVSSGFDLYDFDVHGKSGHGSQPHTANDAILAVSQLIVMLQQIVSRNIDPLKTAIFSIGLLSGGSAVNIIPGEARAEGVARYYDNQSAEVIREKALDIAEGVGKLSGCQIDVTVQKGYACVENDGNIIDFIEGAVKAELG